MVETLKEWCAKITKKNVSMRLWQMPPSDWINDIDREIILDSLPIFIEKIKEAGVGEPTLYRYQKILNHAHSNTLGKLKMTQADREANLDIGTQEDWTSAGPSLEEGEE